MQIKWKYDKFMGRYESNIMDKKGWSSQWIIRKLTTDKNITRYYVMEHTDNGYAYPWYTQQCADKRLYMTKDLFQELIDSNVLLLPEVHNLAVRGYEHTWAEIDRSVMMDGTEYLLLQSECFGEDAPCLLIKDRTEVINDNCWNSLSEELDEYFSYTADQELYKNTTC